MVRDPNLGETPRERTQRLAREAQSNKPAATDTQKAAEKNKNKRKVKQLRYPTETLTETSDYMQIQVVKYTPPGIGIQGGDAFLAGKLQGSIGFKGAQTSETENRKRAKEKTLAYIQLPIPAKLGDSNKANWNKGELNVVGQLAGGLVQQFMKNPDGKAIPDLASIQGAIGVAGRALQGLGSQAGGLMGVGQDALTTFAINMIPGANISFSEFQARTRGIVLNPNMEFLFNGPELRQFSFFYTFVARNPQEGEVIKQIIRTFKQSMSPRSNIDVFGSDQLFGAFLQSPDIFKIRYMSGNKEHPFLNKFKFCALTNMEVNYNAAGEGYVSYEDGTPVIMTMGLSFSELTPVYNEDYDSEFGRGGVGF